MSSSLIRPDITKYNVYHVTLMRGLLPSAPPPVARPSAPPPAKHSFA